MSERAAIGVDLGGTKMLVGVVGEGSTVLYRNTAASAGREAEELLELLEEELRAALEARPEAVAIGLGVPCTVDRRSGRCVSSVHLPLIDVAIRDRVAAAFGLPTTIDNDANVAMLGEHRHGVARGCANAVMLTVGTGIGGGLIVDGRLYRGSSGAGAEMGHVVLAEDGPRCNGNCPNRGCVEALASGTALAREGRAAADRSPDSRLGHTLRAGAPIDGREIIAAARGGDGVAIEVVELVGRRLGAALTGLANTFDPDVIVLGGGVMAAGDLLLDPARAELRERALPPQNEVPLRAAELGVEAGMVGAATLALEELDEGPAVGA